MIQKIKEKLLNREMIMYIIFGVLTTVVNFAAYWLLGRITDWNIVFVVNPIAWVVAVLFAFITNKLFVFESKSWEFMLSVKELASFVVARLASFAFEELALWLAVDILSFNELYSKAVVAVIVVIMNYILSKLFVFKKK